MLPTEINIKKNQVNPMHPYQKIIKENNKKYQSGMQSSRAVVRIVQRDPFILIMGQNEIGHLFNILFRLP